MKVERKEGVGKIKIIHNKTLLWVIIFLIVLLIGIIYFIIHNNNTDINNQEKTCVPATCCHATECVLSEEALMCSHSICSAVCSGPLDCGAGHCEFVDNKCKVVPDN